MENEKSKHSGIVNNFYGPVGQYIEHVEHNHFGMSADGGFQFDGDNSEVAQRKLFPDLPTAAEMQMAVAETVRQGLWWSNRSWAVVYRVYQMKGYMQGISTFVREVAAWKMHKTYECNYDAVQKPIAHGLLIGQPEKWLENGAPKQAAARAFAMLEILEKKQP